MFCQCLLFLFGFIFFATLITHYSFSFASGFFGMLRWTRSVGQGLGDIKRESRRPASVYHYSSGWPPPLCW